MPRFLRGVFSLLGRVVLASIFLASAGMNHIPHYQETLTAMEGNHVPYPQVLLPGALVFMIAGGLSLLLGFKARFGALLLLIFLGMASYYFHNFWDYSNDQQMMQNQMAHFMKNASLGGAMLYIIGNGAGYWSVDGREV